MLLKDLFDIDSFQSFLKKAAGLASMKIYKVC